MRPFCVNWNEPCQPFNLSTSLQSKLISTVLLTWAKCWDKSLERIIDVCSTFFFWVSFVCYLSNQHRPTNLVATHRLQPSIFNTSLNLKLMSYVILKTTKKTSYILLNVTACYFAFSYCSHAVFPHKSINKTWKLFKVNKDQKKILFG